MEDKRSQEKEYILLGNLVGIVASMLTISLITAEIMFLKFEIAMILSILLMILSIWAYRKCKCRLYEIVAFICVLNIMVLGCIIIKDRGLIPDINYEAVVGS